MHCPSCAHENPTDSRFCLECGAALAIRCDRCGAQLPGEAKFCNQCGAARAAPEPRAPERDLRAYTPPHLADKILRSKTALEGERKQVSVLFADVKGSMALAERLDPEEWHRILERFFEILSEGVHRFEGTVNQYTGDGIMALFGAPIAHEDHARRACYAALRIRDKVREYADELRVEQGLSFGVRIGLNSGEVVVGKIGDDLRMDYTAQGHTVGLAQRMEQLAESGRICASEHTARLAEGFFELRDLGASRIKGVAEPVGVYELEGVGAMQTRLDVSRARGFSKFVGRDAELGHLESALAQALADNGQVVGVVAEAGTGKSRLCLEFVEACQRRGVRVNEAHCPAHGQSIPYLPLLELLRDVFGIGDRDSDQDARRKIAGELVLLDEKFRELLPLVFEFLGVADPERPAPAGGPEERQRQLFAFVRHLTQARSEREPTILFLDDLHWIDPGSDAFLAHAVEATQGTRTLLLVNFRPEYHAGWMSKTYYRQLPLQALGREAIEELLADLLGPDSSVAALPARIHDRTGGNPFFIEEIVQSLVESGSLQGAKGAYRLAGPVDELEIPDTVQSVLAARIDRLAEREKRLLQTASVIDKEFSESILKQVAELPQTDLSTSLGALVLAEFLLEKALYPEVEYAFKHPLTQEVALRSQLADRRRGLHAAVARAIEELDADRLDERAPLIAHHWHEAGEGLQAARWHRRAAEWMGVRDLAGALAQWRQLCGALEDVPPSRERSELRLAGLLQIMNLGIRLGHSADESAAAFAEARALAAELEDPWSLTLATNIYSVLLTFEGRLRESLELCEEASRLAAGTHDVALQLFAAMDLTHTLEEAGRLERALEVCERALAHTPDDVTVGRPIRGTSPYLMLQWMRGMTSMLLGHLPGARRDLERALELALEHAEVEMPGWIHFWRSDCAWFAGDLEGALHSARSCLENAEQTASALTAVFGYMRLGHVHLARCSWDEAVDALERALRITREEGAARVEQPMILAWLAEAHGGRGELELALTLASEAIAASRELGTPWKEICAHVAQARALRLRGERGFREEADEALRAAEELVKETGARVYLPFLREERAALEAAVGDAAACERDLVEAQRLFSEMGATARAERAAERLERPEKV